MAAPIFLCLLVLALFFQTNLTFSTTDQSKNLHGSTSDVHDLLPTYGLPKGILPNNVKSYTLSATGEFTVELKSTCYVQFDQLVYYEKKIGGKLSYGAVHGAYGIQAKKLFVWLPVTGIEADMDSGTVQFFVGPLSETLPAQQFEDVPVCKRKAFQRADLASM